MIQSTEQLIQIFTVTKPYRLSYEYRRKHSSWNNDKKFIDELIKGGKCSLIEKTNKKITYEYHQ